MNADDIARLGDELHAALRAGTVLAPLTDREPGITIDDAYHVSLRFLERRLADGEKLIGKKIGVTSKPVQDMLGVHQPDFGFLTDRMHYPNGAAITVAGNLIDLYARLVRGSDLEFRGSFNSPSLMFDAVAIAGK